MYGINQEGSSFMYLSRVPVNQDIHTYDGSGEWVKIYTLGFELHRSVDNWITWLPKAGYRVRRREHLGNKGEVLTSATVDRNITKADTSRPISASS